MSVMNILSMKRKREIGKRLRKVRKSLGLSQGEFANMAGVSAGTISQYERGNTEIPVSFLEYLNKKHGISSNWVLFGTGMMKTAGKGKRGNWMGGLIDINSNGPPPSPIG